jgi:hypothetical protein
MIHGFRWTTATANVWFATRPDGPQNYYGSGAGGAGLGDDAVLDLCAFHFGEINPREWLTWYFKVAPNLVEKLLRVKSAMGTYRSSLGGYKNEQS